MDWAAPCSALFYTRVTEEGLGIRVHGREVNSFDRGGAEVIERPARREAGVRTVVVRHEVPVRAGGEASVEPGESAAFERREVEDLDGGRVREISEREPDHLIRAGRGVRGVRTSASVSGARRERTLLDPYVPMLSSLGKT